MANKENLQKKNDMEQTRLFFLYLTSLSLKLDGSG
jgi:hypothetical protein